MAELDYESQLRQAVKVAKPLHPIFDRVLLGDRNFNPHRRAQLPVSQLTADGLAKRAFPELSLEGDWAEDEKRLKNLHPDALEETMPYLFQKYGWRIGDPENTDKQQDVAFCDVFRVAQAMKTVAPEDGYLLVKGDFTGIQEYIYHDIQPKRAGGLANLSRRLRARSILVSLLTDFVANIILRELGLPSWHLLFAGGGHFNLLLPGGPMTQGKLKLITESLDKEMHIQFGDRLELIIAPVECSSQDLREKANDCFERVNAEVNRRKYRQHRKDLHDLFYQEVEKGKKDEITIGGMFPNQNYLLEIVSKKQLDYREPKYDGDYTGDLILAEFEIGTKLNHTLLAVKSLNQTEKILIKNKGEIQHVHILSLNNTDFLPPGAWFNFDFPVSFGFRFLGRNAPKNDDDVIKDFEQIAKIDQEEKKKGDGFLRLGALMLDVDNLGLIFSHGLARGGGTSLAHSLTLSRELNYFFTAHFDTRAKQKEHQVYIVYSGGDDAFAVGKWDKLIRFAKQMHVDFLHFICPESDYRNPDLHFSAGLFMGNPFYPIGRFYRDVKTLQDKAKKRKEKNSVNVFDHTLGWAGFADKIELGDEFRDVLKKGKTESARKFSMAFAYRIMQLVKNSYYERDTLEEDSNGNKLFHRRGGIRMANFARNVANMRYLFARNGFTEKDIVKITGDLEKRLLVSFLTDAFDFDKETDARDYLVALNFALLQIRSKTQAPEHE